MSNNNNKQPLDLTEPLLVATEGTTTSEPGQKNETPNISHSDEASTSIPIIDRITEVNQTPYHVDESDDPIGFLLKCAERGDNRGKQCPSICKVSRIHRDLSKSSFTPQLVSIGPIHRENKKLEEFEWLKGCYLNDLLGRCEEDSKQPKETILEACLQKVKTKIPQIKKSYAGMIENDSDDKVAGMMVMDGCFILEFCFKHEDEDLYLPNKMQNLRIAMDLMLLENQVPFVVLQALFDCLVSGSVTLRQVLDTHFAPYVMLFRSLLPEKISTTDSDYDHLLGYLHKRYQLGTAKSSKHHQEDEEQIEKPAFHSIVDLDRSGMNFKPHQEDVWSMTIKFQSSHFVRSPWFWSKTTLLMPALVIQDFTELILRNFIAYEQSFPQDHRYYFTSYAHAMDKLIDSQEDIAKLVESKVLVNNLGSNQEAAAMINNICKNVHFTDFYYTDEFKRMDTYYNGYWPNHLAWLRRVYFSNPWSAIALVAAIILFGLTVVQTVYTIMAA